MSRLAILSFGIGLNSLSVSVLPTIPATETLHDCHNYLLIFLGKAGLHRDFFSYDLFIDDRYN